MFDIFLDEFKLNKQYPWDQLPDLLRLLKARKQRDALAGTKTGAPRGVRKRWSVLG